MSKRGVVVRLEKLIRCVEVGKTKGLEVELRWILKEVKDLNVWYPQAQEAR